jgi:formiminotetrahydrofolate cyclodeaminase
VTDSAERPLAELLGAIAESTATPGGGSAAAWAGALAAALVEMTAGFAHSQAATERARELRSDLLAAGQRELTAYEPVLEAARLPADDPSRAERLGSALAAASESALAIARAAAELAELGAAVAARSKPALTGDAVAGVLLAEATCAAAGRMVEINLAGRERDPGITAARALAERAAAARDQATEGA